MITAKLRYLRISPRKIRLVANLIKGLSAAEAEKQLRFLAKRAAKPILKLLNSALANAQHNANLTKESLYVVKVVVEAGPILKRWRPRAMGRATPIMKRTSHLTLILDQREPLPSQKDGETLERPLVKPIKEKPTVKEEKKKLKSLKEIQRIEEEKPAIPKPKPVPPPRPYPTTSQSKKRFFSRQTFGNVKKIFRRKSL